MLQANKHTVFLVDDEQDALEMYERALVQKYRVAKFANAENALAATLTENPTCMVIDYRMPDLSGVDLIRKCRVGGYEGAALMVTAFAEMDEVVFAGQTTLIYRIVPKPVEIELFRDLVELTVAESRFRANLEGRRRHPRFHFPISLDVCVDNAWRTIAARDISLGGLRLEMTIPAPVSPEVRLRLRDGGTTVEAEGHLAHTKLGLVGLKFVNAGPDFLQALGGMITSQRYDRKHGRRPLQV
jgi:DNA-binding response OmpR family regulator